MELWADWVRASLYLTDFLKDLDWDVSLPSARRKKVDLPVRQRHHSAIYHRPDMECFADQIKFMESISINGPTGLPRVLTPARLSDAVFHR